MQLMSSTAPDHEVYKLQKPLLLVLADNDPIAIPAGQLDTTQRYAPDLTVKGFPTGHWLMLEAKDAVNRDLEVFLDGQV